MVTEVAVTEPTLSDGHGSDDDGTLARLVATCQHITSTDKLNRDKVSNAKHVTLMWFLPRSQPVLANEGVLEHKSQVT